MNTIPRNISAPVRREEIFRLATEIRARYDPNQIEHIAQENGIVLVRTEGPPDRDAGFAYIEYARRPMYLESLSHPDDPLVVWGSFRQEPVRAIVINTNSGIPEREVFWHEWYHLFHSPHGVQRSGEWHHRFSTEVALHNQEERRAEEFAAAVLVPSLQHCLTIAEVVEHFCVSERLAERVIQLRQVTHRMSSGS